MHELSIADALLAIATEHAGGRRIARIDVEVGHLRQVVPDALAFAWQLVSAGTSAEGAELVLHDIPVRGRCRGCGDTTRQDRFPLTCAACGGSDLQIVTGEELRVESLEVTDESVMCQEAR